MDPSSPEPPVLSVSFAVPSSAPSSSKEEPTGMATMAGRRHKVALAPGHSHMDWMRLMSSPGDHAGTGGRVLKVTKEELKKHNTKEDCWLVLRGKVYNVTKYIEFHPGGVEEIMKGAGRDATSLFDKKHAWVNADGMLARCFVGVYVPN